MIANHQIKYSVLTALMLLFFSISFQVRPAAALEWDRYRLTPGISITEAYTDNLFLTDEEKEDDYITRVSPELIFDVAIETGHYLSFSYKGDFEYYASFDNFRKDRHTGEVGWSMNRPVGHTFKAGIRGVDTSVQPFSAEDRQKSFTTWEAFLDLQYKVGNFSETGFRYDFTQRSFDDPRDESDDYDRHDLSLNFLYGYLSQFPLLLEYRLTLYDANDLDPPSTDFIAHAVLIGARWQPGARLSGALRVGYTITDFDGVSDFDGLMMDTDLGYALSEITTLKLSVTRLVQNRTAAQRETGNYFISTQGKLTAVFRYWESMPITAYIGYTKNEFEGENREDDLFEAGITARYRLKDGLSFSAQYQYRQNESDLDAVDYTENRIEVGFRLSI